MAWSTPRAGLERAPLRTAAAVLATGGLVAVWAGLQGRSEAPLPREDGRTAAAGDAFATSGGAPAVAPRPILEESVAIAPAGPSIVLERLEMARPGVPVAVIRIDGNPPARHFLGDAMAPGVRLARIDLDGVSIERQGRRELLKLPRGVEPLHRESTRPVPLPRLSAMLPRPATPEVAQLLDGAPGPALVAISASRENPARPGLERQVAAEALRLSGP